jgi:D-3-phosphoglycerate dehydrogenase
MKTSFPKQDIRIVLLEGIHQSAVDAFKAAGYNRIEHHAKALPRDE